MPVAIESKLLVTASRAELVGCVEMIVGVAKKRTTLDALKCIRIVAANGCLALAATNLELWAGVTARQVEVEADGEVLTEAGRLLDAVRSVGGDNVRVGVTGNRLTISGASGTCNLPVELSTFPSLPDSLGAEDGFSIAADDLRSAAAFALHATPKGEIKHAIKGLLFETGDGQLTVMATDDRRVAVADMAVKVGGRGCNVIVPTDFIREIAAILPDGEIAVTTNGNAVEFSAPDFHCRCPLLEGVAPPYRKLTGRKMPGRLTVGSEEWLSSLSVIALATDEKRSRVRLDLSPSGIAMTSATESSDASSSVPCKIEGPPTAIGLNVTFLIQAIQVLACERVSLEWDQPNNPVILRSEGGGSRLVLIVPVDLNA